MANTATPFCRIMEARARRRIAVLSSHVNPPEETTASPTRLRASACASDADGAKETENGHTDCVFCKIIRGELYEDDACAFWIRILCVMGKIIGAMCSKVPLISNAVMKATGCDSFNLLVNNGAAAGQVIYHTHIHIIPRKPHDCLWTSESIRRGHLKLGEEASHLADRVRESLTMVNVFEDSSKTQTSSLVANQI